MKFLIYGLVVLAATVYVAESQQLAETLVARAEGIVRRAKAELARFHGAGRGHLVAELEHEIARVEQLEKELKTLPHGTILEMHQIHQIEEQLLQHENRLAEEVARIDAHSEQQPHQRHELEARAVALLARAKQDLARLHSSGRGHLVQEIEHEIQRIEELVHELRSHPSSTLEGQHGHQIEMRLAEHERRLAEELRRIEGQ